MKAFFSRTRVASLCIFALLLIMTFALFSVAYNGWRLVQPAPHLLVGMSTIISSGVFLVLIARYFVQSIAAKKYVLVGFLACFSVFILIWGILAVRLAHSAHYIYESPNGVNQLIVIEGGFIDASIRAYPLYGIFYKEQNNGSLSYHDLWSTNKGQLIHVEWLSDSEATASINRMNYISNVGSNDNDHIQVLFYARGTDMQTIIQTIFTLERASPSKVISIKPGREAKIICRQLRENSQATLSLWSNLLGVI